MSEKKIQINYTYLAIGAGIASVAVASYLFFRKKQTITTTETNKPKPSKQKAQTFQERYTRVISNILNNFSESDIEELKPQVMKAIYCGQYQLANQQAKQIVLKTRRRRRRAMHDKEEYCKICKVGQTELQELLDKHLGAILARFKIDKSFWINETSKWSSISEETAEQWSTLLRQQDEKLLDSLRNPSLKPKPFAIIKNILQYKQKELQIFDPDKIFVDGDLDENNKYSILQAYIEDMVYDKFSMEQEDIQYSISTFNDHLKQELEPKYEAVSELMTNLIFNQDDNQSQNQDEGNIDDDAGGLFD